MKESVARAIRRVSTAYRWHRRTGDWKTAITHALRNRPLEVHDVAATPTFYCAIHEDLRHMHYTLDPVHIAGVYLSDSDLPHQDGGCTFADRACAVAVAADRVHEIPIPAELSDYRPYSQRQTELEDDLYWFRRGWHEPVRVTEVDEIGGILEYHVESADAHMLTPERLVNLCLGSQDHLGGMVTRTGLYTYDVVVFVREGHDFTSVRKDLQGASS